MITIELTTENTRGIIELDKAVGSQLDNLPFNKFAIQFPFAVFKSKNDIYDDLLQEQEIKHRLKFSNPMQQRNIKKQLEKQAEFYSSSLVTFHVEKKSGHVKIDIKDVYSHTLLSFKVMSFMQFLPIIEENNIHADGRFVAHSMLKVLNKTIEFFNSPKIVKEVAETKELKAPGAYSPSSKKKKNYIYKTVYKFKNLNQAERIYNRVSEGWLVRGHWREYKNGNRIWIDSYAKGTPDKVAQEKAYKITQAL